MATKVLSLRIPEELAAELTVVARANGISVSKAIRLAVEDYVAAEVADKAFKARLKKRIEEDNKLLKRLAE